MMLAKIGEYLRGVVSRETNADAGRVSAMNENELLTYLKNVTADEASKADVRSGMSPADIAMLIEKMRDKA